MNIPDFQSIMLPLLQSISDGKEHKYSELVDKLFIRFQLSEQERRELLPSGKQTVFRNRVGWAKTYLKKAGLLDSPKRASCIITELGLEVLNKNHEKIDISYLKQFPTFVFFKTKSNSGIHYNIDYINDNKTPEENLDKNYQQIRESLALELLNKVINQSAVFFERLVVELLVKMGYGGSMGEAAAQVVGKNNDEGIDGVINQDKLGLDIVYIQAKRWQSDSNIGRPEIQKFVGALAGKGAKKGVFITTAKFTKEAREYAPKNETKIVLIDGEQLAQLMIDYNLGCTTQQIYELKKVDNDYFDEDF